MCNRLFHKDMFAHIRSSETLLRIHSTAEQFDPAAEALSGPFQVRFPACCNLLALWTCPSYLSACPVHLPSRSLSFCICPLFLSSSATTWPPMVPVLLSTFTIVQSNGVVIQRWAMLGCLLVCLNFGSRHLCKLHETRVCGSCLKACIEHGIPETPCKLVHLEWRQ